MWHEKLIDNGMIPDFIMKMALGIVLRRQAKSGTAEIEEWQERLDRFMREMESQPVACRSDDSKRQHYEIPAAFFRLILGERMKYSCCLWTGKESGLPAGPELDRAEHAMLALTAERAEIKDGMDILELGCGWGSLSLYLAERYKNLKITAVSHSASQKRYIDSRATETGLRNIRVITSDMNDFIADDLYDRIVSVEMLEHMRNWKELFRRVSGWLKPEGKFFFHIFTTEGLPWFYNADDDAEWMAKHFFAGGMMPSSGLPLFFQENLSIERIWNVNGTHYAKTLAAWLKAMDNSAKDVRKILDQIYGKEADIWFNRWRLFFLSCSVFFRFRKGNFWHVTHYLFRKRQGM